MPPSCGNSRLPLFKNWASSAALARFSARERARSSRPAQPINRTSRLLVSAQVQGSYGTAALRRSSTPTGSRDRMLIARPGEGPDGRTGRRASGAGEAAGGPECPSARRSTPSAWFGSSLARASPRCRRRRVLLRHTDSQKAVEARPVCRVRLWTNPIPARGRARRAILIELA